MGSFKEDTYQEEVPEGVDKSQEEWGNLSYHAQYYYVKEGRKDGIREAARERKQNKREKVNDIKSQESCKFCDESTPVCLDFHHTSDKAENISDMVNDDYSWERIESEIEKCDVVCANCHRKKHADLI